MNKHVKENLELADRAVFVQDDDYPVDPLDLPDYSPAPGKAATEKRQGVEQPS